MSMNKGAAALAVANGADAKKLSSIDTRLAKLIADMRKQGVCLQVSDGHAALVHRAGRSHTALGMYEL